MKELIDSPEEEVAAELAQQRREEAFAAAPFQWKGIRLKPLAIMREMDWKLHCRRIGLPPLAEVINDADMFGPYAARLIWFCAHDEDQWQAPSMAYPDSRIGAAICDAAIREWIDKNVTPEDAPALMKLALQIHDRAHANHALSLADDEEDDEGNECGPSASLNTRALSLGPAPDSSRKDKSITRSHRKGGGPTSIAAERQKAARSSGPPTLRGKRRK